MIRPRTSTVVLAVLCTALTACHRPVVAIPDTPPSATELAQLWIDPGGTPRDLFWGVGGRRYAPDAQAVYTQKVRDDGGFSVSYDVEDPEGVEWSAKIGPEAQTEVVVSRLLWGLGYHQPPAYYLPSWKLDNGGRTVRVETEARFRPKLPGLKHRDDTWRWADNPFLGAREFRGLLVILLMVNSTDLKDDNNSIYDVAGEFDGAPRWFVVRDLGAAFGVTGRLAPRRNWLAGFERQAFLTRVEGERVDFDYTGRHRELLSMITPDDVRWAARRMQRLTSRQLRDAFRAGNYADADATRFIARLEEKIADGLALRVDRRVRRGERPRETH